MKTNQVYRCKENPLIRPTDLRPAILGMEISCVLNPGVFHFAGRIWLVLRVAERPVQKEGIISFPIHDQAGRIRVISFDKSDPSLDLSDPRVIHYDGQDYLTTLSYLRLVSSSDGIHFSEDPDYPPIFGEGASESFGIEDCRVAKMEDDFYLTYTKVSPFAVGVGLMKTTDWKYFQRMGMIFPPHNKDCALFERKVDGMHHAFHRPSSVELGGNYIWIAESPDLMHWGAHHCLLTTRKGSWDSARIGAGGPPIETSEGFLEIYHGADEKNRYCLGAFLLDKKDLTRVLARSADPLVEPSEPYECKGFFGNVVFTNGHVREGDSLQVYYGASDEVICGAKLSIDAIMDTLK